MKCQHFVSRQNNPYVAKLLSLMKLNNTKYIGIPLTPPVTITVTRDNKSQSGKKSVGNFMQMFLYHYAFLEHFGPF